VVGALLTATATSLPELVTTIAAVRRGALQLAVGGIVGGNTFDVLFLSLSDVAYRDGSIYHAMGERDALLIVAGILMTAILLMGLILRHRRGIGFEGTAISGIYAGVVALQVYLG
jgi:cation:H+ antiporter